MYSVNYNIVVVSWYGAAIDVVIDAVIACWYDASKRPSPSNRGNPRRIAQYFCLQCSRVVRNADLKGKSSSYARLYSFKACWYD